MWTGNPATPSTFKPSPTPAWSSLTLWPVTPDRNTMLFLFGKLGSYSEFRATVWQRLTTWRRRLPAGVMFDDSISNNTNWRSITLQRIPLKNAIYFSQAVLLCHYCLCCAPQQATRHNIWWGHLLIDRNQCFSWPHTAMSPNNIGREVRVNILVNFLNKLCFF